MVKWEEMPLQKVYDNPPEKSTHPDVLCNLFLFFLGLCVDRVTGIGRRSELEIRRVRMMTMSPNPRRKGRPSRHTVIIRV